MRRLFSDRRLLFPVILTAIAIAVGSVLIIVLADDADSGGSATGSATPVTETGTGGALMVDISDFKFMPESVTVKAGSKVSWVNKDSAQHTATATATATASGDFDTGTLKKGQSKTLTLDKPGTYTYICEFHAFMKGKVVVQ